MPTTMRYFSLLGTLLLLTATSFSSQRPDSAAMMADAASKFLSLTPDDQLKNVAFGFETTERTNWNFLPIPGQRKGLALKDMTPEQRIALHQLLQAALSTEGYLKAASIQQLERLQGELENRPEYRDPGLYYLSIFGQPSSEEAWGWRFEGHHLSINFSIVEGKVATTPTFMGTNPGQVRESAFSGLEVLSTEITLARQLMHLFDEKQLEKVIIAEEAPREIITGNSRVALLDNYEGLPFTEMNSDQQDLLVLIISSYVHNLEMDIAAAQHKRIKDAGLENLFFAWAGKVQDRHPHYYRIHGPNLLIEYDNTQNNANHVHSVWRDLENDFGRDYLKQHYEHSNHSNN